MTTPSDSEKEEETGNLREKKKNMHSGSLPMNAGRRYNARHHTSALPQGRAQQKLHKEEEEIGRGPSAFDGNTRNELLTSIDRLISQSLLELNNNTNLGINRYRKNSRDLNKYQSAPNLNNNHNNLDDNSNFGSKDSIYHMQEKTIRLANGMEANVVIRAVKKPDTSRPSLIQSLQPSTSLLSMTGVYQKEQVPFSEKTNNNLDLSRKLSDSASSKDSSSSISIASDASSYERKMKEKYQGYTFKKVVKKFNKTSNQHKRNICDIYMDQRRRTEELLLNLEMDLNTRGYGRLRVPAVPDN